MRRRRSFKALSGMSTWKGRTLVAVSTGLLMTDLLSSVCRSTQWPERGPHLRREEVRLLPSREVVALVDLVEVDEVGISALGPGRRRLIKLSRKDAHCSWDGDTLEHAARATCESASPYNVCGRNAISVA